MKSTWLFYLACLPATAGLSQVTLSVNEPLNANTYTSPVTVSATASSPNGPSGWTVYLDSQLVIRNTDTTGRLNSTFTATPGTHTVVIKGYDNNGNLQTATENITVNSSALPTPPGNALSFANLQNANAVPKAWTFCDGTCSGSTAGGTGVSTPLTGVTSPSLSGSAMGFSSRGTTVGDFWNTLYYRHLDCPAAGCTSVSNFLEDVWFYLPASSSNLQATEYDPGVYDGAYKSFASMQCDSASGKWRFWNSAANTWTTKSLTGAVIPTYNCGLLSQTNAWHHYQLYIKMDFAAHQINYQTFVVDGVTVYQNLGNLYNALAQTGDPTFNIEEQIDNKVTTSTPVTDTEYLDNYNLWVW